MSVWYFGPRGKERAGWNMQADGNPCSEPLGAGLEVSSRRMVAEVGCKASKSYYPLRSDSTALNSSLVTLHLPTGQTGGAGAEGTPDDVPVPARRRQDGLDLFGRGGAIAVPEVDGHPIDRDEVGIIGNPVA